MRADLDGKLVGKLPPEYSEAFRPIHVAPTLGTSANPWRAESSSDLMAKSNLSSFRDDYIKRSQKKTYADWMPAVGKAIFATSEERSDFMNKD